MIDRHFVLVVLGIAIGGVLSTLGFLAALDHLVKRSVNL